MESLTGEYFSRLRNFLEKINDDLELNYTQIIGQDLFLLLCKNLYFYLKFRWFLFSAKDQLMSIDLKNETAVDALTALLFLKVCSSCI